MAVERTLVLIKPDAVRRGLAGEILRRFEQRGLAIQEARLLTVDRGLAEEHYAEHADDDGRDQSSGRRPRNDSRRPGAVDAGQPRAWIGLAGVGRARDLALV